MGAPLHKTRTDVIMPNKSVRKQDISPDMRLLLTGVRRALLMIAEAIQKFLTD